MENAHFEQVEDNSRKYKLVGESDKSLNVREAIAMAKIVDTSDEVSSIASTLRRYPHEMRPIDKR